MKSPWIIPAIIALLFALLACCLCLALASGWFIYNFQSPGSNPRPYSAATPEYQFPDFPGDLPPASLTPLSPRATPTPQPQAATPSQAGDTPQPSQGPTPTDIPLELSPAPLALAGETLNTLRQAEIPISDMADLARRLEGKTGIPTTLQPPSAPLQVGDRQTFTASDTDTNEDFEVQATLRYVTDHAYFWIEDGVNYNQRDLRRLAETFENEIYPTDREFFGSEWTPGVDGDPHLYILYARGLGSGVGGYFSSIDSYNPQLVEHSNGHEMFFLNADGISLGREYTYGILAHEFQHMIHWYRDRNENAWINEGFSDLAMFLNGYDIGGHDWLFAQDPDLQLNDWPNDSSQTVPHYGASFLFFNYFLDRFGEDATKTLVGDPANGLDSIDRVLQRLDVRDPQSGAPVGADDVFSDWVLATYLQDGSVGDGRFTYHNNPDAPQTHDTEAVFTCGPQWENRDVHQYGVDFISIRCPGGTSTTLRFQAAQTVAVVPAQPYSGDYAFWSNKGDDSDISLTRTFDFSGLSGPLTLTYQTWYDLETDFDYLYVLASLDGESWQMLDTPSGTDKDLTGANYGWGYNGISGNSSDPAWINESVDISQFAGQVVQIRFEYITDGAVNGEGLLLDDVAVPEAGYFTDFEQDDGGWQAAGFVRIANSLPQTLRLSLIRKGAETTVEYIPLSASNTAEIPLQFGSGVDEVVLAVSGTTRFTRQQAIYRFSFGP